MPKIKSCLSLAFKGALLTGITVETFRLGQEIHAAYHIMEDAAELADAIDDPECECRCGRDRDGDPRFEYPASILPTVGSAEALRVIEFAEKTSDPAAVIENAIATLQTHLADKRPAKTENE